MGTRRNFFRKISLLGGFTGLNGFRFNQVHAENLTDPLERESYHFNRRIPVEEGYDLVFAGGGPTGSAAAVYKERLGL